MKNKSALTLIVICVLLVLVCDLHYKTILSMQEQYNSLQSEYMDYIDASTQKVNQMREEVERYKSKVRRIESVLEDNKWLIEYFESED